MYGAMHPKSDVDRLFMKRKEGGSGLFSVEQCLKEKKTAKVYMWQTQKSC